MNAIQEPAELWEFDSLSDTSSSSSREDSVSAESEQEEESANEAEQVDLETLSEENLEPYENCDRAYTAPAAENSSVEKEGSLRERDDQGNGQEWSPNDFHTLIPDEARGQDFGAVRQEEATVQQVAQSGTGQLVAPLVSLPSTLTQGVLAVEQNVHNIQPAEVLEPHELPEDDADGVEDESIWQRTRARNPLTKVTIEELEAMLQDDLVDPYEDDEAYHDFLKVLQGDTDDAPSLLPEEEDDDYDFEIDLDDLIAGGEADLEPTLPRSPLQTRFGRGNGLLASPVEMVQPVHWVPQGVFDDVDPSEQPLPDLSVDQAAKATTSQTCGQMSMLPPETSQQTVGGKGRDGQQVLTGQPAAFAGHGGRPANAGQAPRKRKKQMNRGERLTGAALVLQQRQAKKAKLQQPPSNGAGVVQPGLPVLVPGPSLPQQMLPPLVPKEVCMGPQQQAVWLLPPQWSLAQQGQLRCQAALHLQQLCQMIALLKCDCYDTNLLQQSRAMLSQMMAFCIHHMGLQELRASPFMHLAVNAALEQACPELPPQGPVGGRSQTAAAARKTVPLPSLPAPVQAALDHLRPYMCPRLLPKDEPIQGAWTNSEYRLLEHGLSRFGSRLELVQKFLLPTKSLESIKAHLKVHMDKTRPVPKMESLLEESATMLFNAPPLTPLELDIIRHAIKEHNGSAGVWDIIASQLIPYRGADELKTLYWTTAYNANPYWRKCKTTGAGVESLARQRIMHHPGSGFETGAQVTVPQPRRASPSGQPQNPHHDEFASQPLRVSISNSLEASAFQQRAAPPT